MKQVTILASLFWEIVVIKEKEYELAPISAPKKHKITKLSIPQMVIPTPMRGPESAQKFLQACILEVIVKKKKINKKLSEQNKGSRVTSL